jgi:hypothetical protein
VKRQRLGEVVFGIAAIEEERATFHHRREVSTQLVATAMNVGVRGEMVSGRITLCGSPSPTTCRSRGRRHALADETRIGWHPDFQVPVAAEAELRDGEQRALAGLGLTCDDVESAWRESHVASASIMRVER